MGRDADCQSKIKSKSLIEVTFSTEKMLLKISAVNEKIFVNIYWSGLPEPRVREKVSKGGERIRQEQVHPKDKGRCPAEYGAHAYEKIS